MTAIQAVGMLVTGIVLGFILRTLAGMAKNEDNTENAKPLYYTSEDIITVHAVAPRDGMNHALKIAMVGINHVRDGKKGIIRPEIDWPFFVELDGLDYKIEYISPDEQEALNESLTKVGYRGEE